MGEKENLEIFIDGVNYKNSIDNIKSLRDHLQQLYDQKNILSLVYLDGEIEAPHITLADSFNAALKYEKKYDCKTFRKFIETIEEKSATELIKDCVDLHKRLVEYVAYSELKVKQKAETMSA